MERGTGIGGIVTGTEIVIVTGILGGRGRGAGTAGIEIIADETEVCSNDRNNVVFIALRSILFSKEK